MIFHQRDFHHDLKEAKNIGSISSHIGQSKRLGAKKNK